MPSQTKKSKKKQLSPRWKAVLTTLGFVLLIGFGASAGLVISAISNVPTWSPDKLYGSETTVLYDKNQKPFFNLHAEENRVQVPLDKIPQDMVNAFLATEDQQFYQHHGVNVARIASALFADIVAGTKKQGASTITQQLARNAFLNPEKTWERKIKEAVLAMQLESTYTKDEIMEFYLNKIYFGSGAWGVQTAAQTFYGKDIEKLDLAECAMLTGLVKAPNSYSPFRNPESAKRRQKIVLNNMADCGYITQEQADNAAEETLDFKKQSESDYRYGYYVDYVIDEADRILKEEGLYDNPQDAIFKGGLNIYTSLDPDLQEYSESIYADPANFPPDRKGMQIESAMAIVDNRTGEVRALIGGRKYSSQRGFNRATNAMRQPGSSFKPLVVYGPALEAGIGPSYVIDDSPVTFNFWGQSWSPKNYDNKYRGPITMRTAVQWSVNVYAVKLADQIGIKNGVAFAEKCGISTLVKAGASNDMNLSTALGGITKGVSPLEMASAYSTFANQGVHADDFVISKIVDSSGNTIYEHNPEFNRVMKKETAWAMTDMLVNVVNAGTGTKAKIPNVKCAGKTGTTQNDKDAWFVGYTPYYSCAVWIGNDKGSERVGSAGGTYPAKIWRAVMLKAIKGKSGRDFGPPEGSKQTGICLKSGKLATAACPDSDIEMKYLAPDKMPKESCDLHYLIPICSESGKMATIYCPNPVSQGFLKDAPPGDPEAPPTEYCDIHTSENSVPNPDVNNNPPVDNVTDSKTGAQHRVYICRDPRHSGVYRANIPNPAQSGGCPPGAIEEITIDNPDALPYCSLPDHQINQ